MNLAVLAVHFHFEALWRRGMRAFQPDSPGEMSGINHNPAPMDAIIGQRLQIVADCRRDRDLVAQSGGRQAKPKKNRMSQHTTNLACGSGNGSKGDLNLGGELQIQVQLHQEY
jgi:hypothetical protein